jgi:predicted amidohydrolase YtcJ
VEVAFAAHTVGGWRAAGRDDAGELMPGAPATFAVWRALAPINPSRLPYLWPDQPLPVCLRTVVRGRTVYRR